MNLSSPKRTYQIFLKEELARRVMDECTRMSKAELQKYIDDNFAQANLHGRSMKSAAHSQSRMHRDKAKIAIIELENRSAAKTDRN